MSEGGLVPQGPSEGGTYTLCQCFGSSLKLFFTCFLLWHTHLPCLTQQLIKVAYENVRLILAHLNLPLVFFYLHWLAFKAIFHDFLGLASKTVFMSCLLYGNSVIYTVPKTIELYSVSSGDIVLEPVSGSYMLAIIFNITTA
jgi:hypothetical protein